MDSAACYRKKTGSFKGRIVNLKEGKIEEQFPDYDGYYKVYHITLNRTGLWENKNNIYKELNKKIQTKLLKNKGLLSLLEIGKLDIVCHFECPKTKYRKSEILLFAKERVPRFARINKLGKAKAFWNHQHCWWFSGYKKKTAQRHRLHAVFGDISSSLF